MLSFQASVGISETFLFCHCFLFFIHKASALQKVVCNAGTVSHIKLQADQLHLGIIPHIVKCKIGRREEKKPFSSTLGEYGDRIFASFLN